MAFVLSAQLQLKAPTNIPNIVNQIKQQLNGIKVNITPVISNRGNQQLTVVQKNLNKVSRAAKQGQKSMKNFGESSALAFKRFMAYTTATAGLLKFIGAIKVGVVEAIDFNKEMVRLSQVTGKSLPALSNVSKTITDLSRGLGVSSKELLKASTTLAQAGITAEDTAIALRALAKASLAPSFDDMANTTEGMIAVMRQFNMEAKDMESTFGAINKVAARFAVEAEDIVTAIRRTGGVFAAAGGDINQFMALFTSVRQTTRESAESIATGFRTIITRIQRLRTITFLKNLGIDLQDANGQFIGVYQSIEKLSKALGSLPGTDPRFAQIMEELGGFRQIGKVLPLIQQFGVAQQAYSVALRGQTSLTKDAVTAQLSLANRITKVREEFVAMVRKFAENQAVQKLVDLMFKLASALIKVADSFEPIMPILLAFGGLKLATFTMKNIPNFRKVFGFASGGLVPGKGNRDTVPAMLQPGEFVLRKKAVEKMGAGGLASMNGYAGGGRVRSGRGNYGTPPHGRAILNAIGGLKGFSLLYPQHGNMDHKSASKFLSSEFNNPDSPTYRAYYAAQTARSQQTAQRKVERGKVLKEGESLKDLAAVGMTSSIAFNPVEQFRSPSGQAYRIHRSTLQQDHSQLVHQLTSEHAVAGITKAAKELGARIGAQFNQANLQTFMNSTDFAMVQGGMFEGALAAMGAPYAAKAEAIKGMDFPHGLGGMLGKYFGIPGNIPADATRDLKSKPPGDLMGQYERYVAGSRVKKFAGGGVVKGGGVANLRRNLYNTTRAVDQSLGTFTQQYGFMPSNFTDFVLSNKLTDNAGGLYDIKYKVAGLSPMSSSNLQRSAAHEMAHAIALTSEKYLDPKQKALFEQIAKFGRSKMDPITLAWYDQYFKGQGISQDVMENLMNHEGFAQVISRLATGKIKTKSIIKASNQYLGSVGKYGTQKTGSSFRLHSGKLHSSMASILPTDQTKEALSRLLQYRGKPQKITQPIIPPVVSPTTSLAKPLSSGFSFGKTFAYNRGLVRTGLGLRGKQYSGRMGKFARGLDVSGMVMESAAYTGLDFMKHFLLPKSMRSKRFAGGGSVDSVPALLTPGEFVVNKETASDIGLGNLNRINKMKSGGVVKNYAGGGAAATTAGGMFSGGLGGLLALSYIVPDLNNAFGDLLSAVTGAGMQIMMFKSIIDSGATVGKKFVANVLNPGAQIQTYKSAEGQLGVYKALDKQRSFDRSKMVKQSRKDFASREYQRVMNAPFVGGLSADEQRWYNKKMRQSKSMTQFGDNMKMRQKYARRSTARYAAQQSYGNDMFLDDWRRQARSALPSVDPALYQAEQKRMARAARIVDIKRKIYNFGRGKIGQGFMKAAPIIGAVGSVAGGAIENYGLKQIASGKDGRLAATAGGAVSMGAQGAALLSIFGPLGMALGGLTGAVAGAVNSFIQADKQMRQVQFDKSVDKMNDAIEKVLVGKSGANIQAGNIKSGIIDARRIMGSAGGGQRGEMMSRLEQGASSFGDYITKLASTAKDPDLFFKSNKEIIDFYGTLIDTPISEFKEQITNIIKTSAAAAKAQDHAAVVADKFAERLSAVTALSSALDRAAFSVNRFDNVIEQVSSGGMAQLTDVGIGPLLEDMASFGDSAEFASGILKRFGDSPMSRELIAAGKVSTRVPSALLAARSANPLAENEGQIKSFLDALGNDIPTEIKNALEYVINEQIIGAESNPQKFLEGFQSDPRGTIDKLQGALVYLVEIYQKQDKIMSEFNNKLSGLFSKRLELVQQEMEAGNRVIDIRQQFADTMASLAGTTLSSGQIQGFENQRRQNIGAGGNVAQIGARYFAEQAAAQKLAADAANTSGKELYKFNAQLAGVQTELIKDKAALEFLADGASRAAPALKQLGDMRANREFRRGLAEKFTFAGSAKEVNTLAADISGAMSLSKTGNIDKIAPELRQSLLSFMDSLPDNIKFGFLGGKSKEEVKETTMFNKMKQLGLTDKEAKAVASKGAIDEEKVILQTIEASFAQAASAAEILRQGIESQNKQLGDIIASQNATFLSKLEEVMIKGERDKQQKALDAALKQKGNVQSQQMALGNISKLTGIGLNKPADFEKIQMLGSNLNEIKGLSTTIGKSNRAGALLNFYNESKHGGTTTFNDMGLPYASLASLNPENVKEKMKAFIMSKGATSDMATDFESELNKAFQSLGSQGRFETNTNYGYRLRNTALDTIGTYAQKTLDKGSGAIEQARNLAQNIYGDSSDVGTSRITSLAQNTQLMSNLSKNYQVLGGATPEEMQKQMSSINNTIGSLNTTLSNLNQAAATIPSQIAHAGSVNVNVNFAGGQAMAQQMASALTQMVTQLVQQQTAAMFQNERLRQGQMGRR